MIGMNCKIHDRNQDDKEIHYWGSINVGQENRGTRGPEGTNWGHKKIKEFDAMKKTRTKEQCIR